MKKLFLVLFIVLIFPCFVFAAGTVTGSSELNQNIMKITYSVTFGSDNAAPANVALDSITATSGARLRSVGGWWLLRVDIYPGATGPTDNTDFYIWSVEDKIDVLGGSGANAIDNATVSSVYPATTTQPLFGTEIFDIDNNAVNNATTTIVLILYKAYPIVFP